MATLKSGSFSSKRGYIVPAHCLLSCRWVRRLTRQCRGRLWPGAAQSTRVPHMMKSFGRGPGEPFLPRKGSPGLLFSIPLLIYQFFKLLPTHEDVGTGGLCADITRAVLDFRREVDLCPISGINTTADLDFLLHE